MAKNSSNITLGRRREAVVNVKLNSGKGENTVNGLTPEKYFSNPYVKVILEKAFNLTETLGKFHFQAKATGGGKKGQLTALTLAISRALVKVSETHKTALRGAGLLTVDARVRQRRHIGTGGKARRVKQSPRR